MSQPYFAHAVYGFVLDEEQEKVCAAAVERAKAAAASVEEEEGLDPVDVARKDPAVVQMLKDMGLPANATLFYTGGEDEHPGESATSPETWLVGYGLLGFPGIVHLIPPGFKKKADWLTWVTA